MSLDSLAELREVYRPPAARTGFRVLHCLDVHCRNFIALSPSYVISSARADGRSGLRLMVSRGGHRVKIASP